MVQRFMSACSEPTTVFPNGAVSGRRPTSYPALSQTGTVEQTTSNETDIGITFTGTGRAVGTTVLELEYSNDNSTNWTQFATVNYNWSNSGTVYSSEQYSTDFSTLPYADNRGFRGRWTNTVLGYTESYTSLGQCTHSAYNMAALPAPGISLNDIVFDSPVLVAGTTYRQPVSVTMVEKVVTGDYYNERIELYVEYRERNGITYTPKTASAMLATVWDGVLDSVSVYNVSSLFTFDSSSVEELFIDLAEVRYTVLGDGTFGTGLLGTWAADPAY